MYANEHQISIQISIQPSCVISLFMLWMEKNVDPDQLAS